MSHARAYDVGMNYAKSPVYDDRIIEAINEIRERNFACTARSVAGHLRLSPNVVRFRCEAMRQAGRVNWTPMPGSLHVIESTEELLAQARAELEATVAPEDAGQASTDDVPAKPRPKKKAAPRKKAAAKKATAV